MAGIPRSMPKTKLPELMRLIRRVIERAAAQPKNRSNDGRAFDKLKSRLREAIAAPLTDAWQALRDDPLEEQSPTFEQKARELETLSCIEDLLKAHENEKSFGDSKDANHCFEKRDPYRTTRQSFETTDPFETMILSKNLSTDEARTQLNSTEDVVARGILEAFLDYVEPGSRKDEMIAQFRVKLGGWECLGDKEPYFKFTEPPAGELSARTHPGVEAFDRILSRKDFRKIFFQERGRDSDFEAFRRRLRVHYPKPDDISEDEWTHVLTVLASWRCVESSMPWKTSPTPIMADSATEDPNKLSERFKKLHGSMTPYKSEGLPGSDGFNNQALLDLVRASEVTSSAENPEEYFRQSRREKVVPKTNGAARGKARRGCRKVGQRRRMKLAAKQNRKLLQKKLQKK